MDHRQEPLVQRAQEIREIKEIQKSKADEVLEIIPRDSTDGEEINRVQKIVNGWARRTDGLDTRHDSTRYVGTHVHPVPDLLQTNTRPLRSSQPGRTRADGARHGKGLYVLFVHVYFA